MLDSCLVFHFRLFSQIRGIVNHVVSGQLKSRRLSLMMLRWCAAVMQSIKLQLRDDTTPEMPSLIGIINDEEMEEIKRVPVQGKWVFCVQKIEEAWNMGLEKDLVSRAMHKQLPHEVAKMRQACGAMLRLNSHGMVPFA